MHSKYFLTVATESELNDLLAGREAGTSVEWEPQKRYQISPGTTGLLWTRQGTDTIRPLCIVVAEDGTRRLYGRYAQLRSDLSPLSTWCHILTPEYFEKMGSLMRVPDLDGLEAAWSGLAIAEAKLLAERPLNELRVPACFATQSFALARAKALWHRVPVNDVLSRFDAAYRLLRLGGSNRQGLPGDRLRNSLRPIWASLISLSGNEHIGPDLRPVVAGLRILLNVRNSHTNKEAARFAEPFFDSVPEAETLVDLEECTAERRLELFDKIMSCLAEADERKEPIRRASLPLIAGYLATVAAGGTPSLGLVEKVSNRWPEVIAWSYVLGGLGESVVWSSGFDGLGRLVARDLLRPFHLNEAPSFDFSLDEGQILFDSKLSDPLVHLRIKQARMVWISLLPGVHVLVQLRETGTAESAHLRPKHRRERGRPDSLSLAEGDFIERLADAIAHRLEGYRADEGKRKSSGQRASKKKGGSQRDLL